MALIAGITLAGILSAIIAALITRIILAIGVTVVVYVGIVAVFNALSAEIMQSWQGLPPIALQLCGLAGFDTYLTMVLSCASGLITLHVATGALKKLRLI